jgi:hypothetical protein
MRRIDQAKPEQVQLQPVHENELLRQDKTVKKMKAVSPEDVIPLEKDPSQF